MEQSIPRPCSLMATGTVGTATSCAAVRPSRRSPNQSGRGCGADDAPTEADPAEARESGRPGEGAGVGRPGGARRVGPEWQGQVTAPRPPGVGHTRAAACLTSSSAPSA